jgi:hypothetical protein
MATPATDEYYERYRYFRGIDLGRMLSAANPDKVSQTATTWYNAANTLSSTADTLSSDVLALRGSWTGGGQAGFEKQMFSLVSRLRSLADEAAAMQTGLSMMSSSIAVAKDRGNNVPVAATVGAYSAVLGNAHGYVPVGSVDWARIIADLSIDYAMIEQKVWHGPRPVRSADPPPAAPSPANQGTALQASAAQPVTAMTGGVPVQIHSSGGALAAASPGSLANGPSSPGMMPMGMMGAAGAAGASSDSSRISGARWRDDELAWSRDDHATWVDGDDDRPLPVVGPRTA